MNELSTLRRTEGRRIGIILGGRVWKAAVDLSVGCVCFRVAQSERGGDDDEEVGDD
jgi:hypothetical protein